MERAVGAHQKYSLACSSTDMAGSSNGAVQQWGVSFPNVKA